jgi:catechol 2,3-dioxygenase-like lactoylglutathione lyase family enzyme
MSSISTKRRPEPVAPAPSPRAVDTRLEVVVIPVSDVDRAKRFYANLGWRLDADLGSGDFRVVQLTPPGSPCAVIFGTGVTTAAPGSTQGLVLVVEDLAAARADLIAHGADASEMFHDGFHPAGMAGRLPGPDPDGRSYRSFVSFSDPDGNSWLVQEIKTRLPGRVTEFGALTDVSILTELLRETEMRHGSYEPTAPKHHWSTWYAAYMVARAHGRSPDDAFADAVRHTEGART